MSLAFQHEGAMRMKCDFIKLKPNDYSRGQNITLMMLATMDDGNLFIAKCFSCERQINRYLRGGIII